MGDPEATPESAPPPADPEPAIPGVPLGQRKPEAVAEPITDPNVTELQDRRRPLP
jgi:hypothetical protein